MITPTYYLIEGVNPEPWTAPTFSRRGRFGVQTSKNAQLRAYQNALAEAVLEIRPDVEPITEDLGLDVWFWRELEQYKTESGRKQTRHRADRSNMLKATEDALQARKDPEHPEWAKGVLFKNDKQVVDGLTCVVEQAVGAPARVLLLVRGPGIGRRIYPGSLIETMRARDVKWMEL